MNNAGVLPPERRHTEEGFELTFATNVLGPFLLTAFAACFLGSTQFKGRFNVWGTVLAVWTLLSLVKGVELALQSYRWLNELFFGTALIGAVGMSKVFQRRATRSRHSKAASA